jgi:hypothetical protein
MLFNRLFAMPNGGVWARSKVARDGNLPSDNSELPTEANIMFWLVQWASMVAKRILSDLATDLIWT